MNPTTTSTNVPPAPAGLTGFDGRSVDSSEQQRERLGRAPNSTMFGLDFSLNQTIGVPSHLATGLAAAPAGNADKLACKDIITDHADPEAQNVRHLIMFNGDLDHAYLLRYVSNIKSVLVTPASVESKILWVQFTYQAERNTICNALDTMNTMLLRAGKPRIYVSTIAQQDKIDYEKLDIKKSDVDSQDPDAMLVLFCEKLKGELPVQIGSDLDLNNHLEFQRSWRKAEETRRQDAESRLDKQRKNMETTIETGYNQRTELNAKLLGLEQKLAGSPTKEDVELLQQRLQEKTNELQEAIEKGQGEATKTLQAIAELDKTKNEVAMLRDKIANAVHAEVVVQELNTTDTGAEELEQAVANATAEAIETERVHRAELDRLEDQIKTLNVAAEATETERVQRAELESTIIDLRQEIETLKSASTTCAVEVGAKRARVVDVGSDDLLSQMRVMLQSTIQATVGDVRLLELKQDGEKKQDQLKKDCEKKQDQLKQDYEKKQDQLKQDYEKKQDQMKQDCEKKQDDIDKLKDQLNKVRTQRNSAQSKVKQLENDNNAKTKTNEKLRKRASSSSKTLGWGTRVWTRFLGLDPTNSERIAQLQEQMRDTVAVVHKNKYLNLVNVPAMRPHNQASLDRFFGGNGCGADTGGSGEDGMGE